MKVVLCGPICRDVGLRNLRQSCEGFGSRQDTKTLLVLNGQRYSIFFGHSSGDGLTHRAFLFQRSGRDITTNTTASQPLQHFRHPTDVKHGTGQFVMPKMPTAFRPSLVAGRALAPTTGHTKTRVTQSTMFGTAVLVQFAGHHLTHRDCTNLVRRQHSETKLVNVHTRDRNEIVTIDRCKIQLVLKYVSIVYNYISYKWSQSDLFRDGC